MGVRRNDLDQVALQKEVRFTFDLRESIIQAGDEMGMRSRSSGFSLDIDLQEAGECRRFFLKEVKRELVITLPH